MDVLVVNAGSTSLKLHLVDEAEHSRPLGEDDVRAAASAGGDPAPTGTPMYAGGSVQAAGSVQTGDQGRLDADALNVGAVAHRVVHGGARYRDPVLLDADVLEQIVALEALAPLHNAPALRGIELAMAALPHVPHVAVFDTAFHRTMPAYAATYALPRRLREGPGVSRYGFHGLSVQWSSERAARMLGSDSLRLVVCHLGGGCSVSALHNGRSLDTTMGFSPLEGVPMATRSGSVDPGALIYLLRERKLSLDELERTLNFESGLQAIGGSSEMTELEDRAVARDRDARLAIKLFCYRVAGAVAAMAVAAGGIDALVFTAGIGERSPLVREQICERLRFVGVRVDPTRNVELDQPERDIVSDRLDRDIAAQDSAVRVLVIHAREELIAARAARSLLQKKDRPAGGSGPIRGRE